MFDDFDIGPQSEEYTGDERDYVPVYDEYDDSLRLDEMDQARGDYNLYEEEQVFQDREGEDDGYEQESPADWEDDGYDEIR